jgi:predicted SprT family Zn-dependent metalloprotease
MDAKEVLSGISGLPKEEVQQIFEEVKANLKRLDGCKGPHDFEKDGEGIRAKYRCKKCKGTLDKINYSWYEKGLEHGKAST